MKSPLRYKRRHHKDRYWWDSPVWETQIDKFMKQRHYKYKGGHYNPKEKE